VIGLTPLGICLLAANYGASLVFLWKTPGNYPDDPSMTAHDRKGVAAGRLLFTLMLTLFSCLEASRSLGLAEFLRPAMAFAAMPGSLYYPLSLLGDMAVYAALHGKEMCKHDLAVLANLPSLPMVAAAVSFMAYLSSFRLRRSLGASGEGFLLGYECQAVRRITWMTRAPGMRVLTSSERWEVRDRPWRAPYVYDPYRRTNPHVFITGTSGVGKTTTVYNIVCEARRTGHPVIIVDFKGDFAEAFRSIGWMDRGWAKEYDVGGRGIEPLRPVVCETRMEAVTDLVSSMSVVEEVGQNQIWLIQRVAHGLEPFEYSSLLKSLEREVRRAMEGAWGGPHVRDAYAGIHAKMMRLQAVFRGGRESVDLSEIKPLLLEPEKGTLAVKTEDGRELRLGQVIVFNLSTVGDAYARAVAAEFILRKVERIVRRRGPLAGIEGKKVFLVIDEVHEIARPQRWRRDTTLSVVESIAREARSHGLALVLSTQRLSDVPDGTRQGIGLWLCLKNESPEDVGILTTLTGCPRMAEILSSLPDGYALVFESRPEKLAKGMRAVYGRPYATEQAVIVRLRRRLLGKDVGQRPGQADGRGRPAGGLGAGGALRDVIESVRKEALEWVRSEEAKALILSLKEEDLRDFLMVVLNAGPGGRLVDRLGEATAERLIKAGLVRVDASGKKARLRLSVAGKLVLRAVERAVEGCGSRPGGMEDVRG